jgi:hypothetical protein
MVMGMDRRACTSKAPVSSFKHLVCQLDQNVPTRYQTLPFWETGKRLFRPPFARTRM